MTSVPEGTEDEYAHEPWTPQQCEHEMQRLYRLISQGELAMRRIKAEKLEASRVLARARTRARMDPGRPIVGRYKDQVTVEQFKDWVADQVVDEQAQYDFADLAEDNGRDYMRRLRDQISLAQSLTKVVMAQYEYTSTRGGPR